jgi:hypothetical protein
VSEKSNQMDRIVWQEAERLIHTAQQADIFLILDCCHAGRLVSTRQKPQWSDRIFEYLGACGAAQTTPLPGPDSFTSALIYALEALAEECDRFTSSELLNKILKAPKFGSDGQLPCLFERTLHCVRRLVLEPLDLKAYEPPSSDRNQSNERVDSSQYRLNLQFLLSRIPTDDEYKKLCDGLREIILAPDSLTQQILWKGLYSKEHSSQMPHYARMAAMHWQNKALQKQIRKLSRAESIVIGSTDARQDTMTHYGQPTPAPSEGFAENVDDDFPDNQKEYVVQRDPKPTVPNQKSARSEEDRKLLGKIAIMTSLTTVCIQGIRSQPLRMFVILALVVYMLRSQPFF